MNRITEYYYGVLGMISEGMTVTKEVIASFVPEGVDIPIELLFEAMDIMEV